MIWSTVADTLSRTLGENFAIRSHNSIGGGCINDAAVISDGSRQFFVKLNRADRQDMFAAEAAGLAELARAGAVRVPQPVCFGTGDGQAFLVLEFLQLTRASRTTQTTFGEQLARQHATTRPTFGWDRANTIGSTPQPNNPDPDWIHFWREQRLGYQLSLAKHNGYGGSLISLGERVIDATPECFRSYRPKPALLHGDLWGGNFAADDQGAPVIFDPAVYYGDREADLAMTELFGGFGREFYAAYDATLPRDPGYALRRTLYNLYHILNHLNLFGGSYRAQAEDMMEQLLSELS